MSDVTRILSQIDAGDPHAAEQLLPLVYGELRKLAAVRLAQEKPGQTLQATALVHEAYLRLVGGSAPQQWDGRGHFFAAAAEAMRRILIEAARHRQTARRGGQWQRCELSDADRVNLPINDELLDLDDALVRLEAVDPQAAEVVKLRVFAGMTVEEAASVLNVSARTAKRNWAYARAWLGRELASEKREGAGEE
jgi:RNA polymerase sigma factor (TIGR02999 family)